MRNGGYRCLSYPAYATLVAIVCAVGYLITGFMGSPWIAIIIEVVLLVAVIMVLSGAKEKQKE